MKQKIFFNTILIIVILTSISFISIPENILNDLQKNGYKGSIKFIKTLSYEANEKFGEIEKNNLVSVDSCKYDIQGNLTFSYSKQNYLNEPYVNRYENKYNELGLLIEILMFDNNNNFSDKSTYLYNEKNQLIETNWYFQKIDVLTSKVKYVYNKDGKLIKHNVYNKNGTLTEERHLKYDKKNNLIEEIVSDDKYIYSYNNNNQRVKEVFYKNSKVFQENTIKYDTYHNKLEFNCKNNDLVFKTIYKYDKNNNPIWELTKFNNGDIVITERVIEYYD